MRVSLKWLSELCDLPPDIEALAQRLDMTGTKVEAIERIGEALSGVVVGRILTKEHHPESDHLWVTTVDVGVGEPLQIVCGAQNFEAGDRVPVALVGATLPNGVTIKKAKLRGVRSEGMNCSAAELGLGSDGAGLLILPPDAPVGVPFATYRGLADTVFELEVTPNRPDCLSMAGVAREVAAVLGVEARLPASSPKESGRAADSTASVSIQDAELGIRYCARVVRGVSVGPSPDWLAERVSASGARPINNVVDISNYVMFELGQPLHAFDARTLATLPDGRVGISVRLAETGEKLVTLDGVARDLAPDTLVVADPSGAVALAGVMGGAATEVSDTTVDVLLEAACFKPASVGRTSRRLGLISEASIRFERGVDPTGCVAALDRAAQLLSEVAGGEVAPGIVDVYPRPVAPVSIALRTARANSLLGTSLDAEAAAAPLRLLGLDVMGGPEEFTVTVPTFRPDLEREADLIEEILRLYGMDRVPSSLPAGRGRIGGLGLLQRRRETAAAALRAAGLCEATTWSFCESEDAVRLGWTFGPGERPVRLLNPMSEDQSLLRFSILPGLLRAVANNQRKGVLDVQLYEIGPVWWTAEGRKLPKERTALAGVLSGCWDRPAWNDTPPPLGFFDAKGVIETLAAALGVGRLRLAPADLPWLQPGRGAEVLVAGDVIGWIGEVHPLASGSYECAGTVTAFELQSTPLLKAAREARGFTELPRYPGVKVDLALVVPQDVTAERVEREVRQAGGRTLAEVRLFDVYEGEGMGAGRKSLAFSLLYREEDRTLTDQEVAQTHERLVRKVSAAVGGEARS